MMLRKMSVQLGLVLAALVAIPLVALGFLLMGASQNAVRVSVLRDQEQLAIRAASELHQFIKKPRDLLTQSAAILGTLHADPWRQETALVELALHEEEIFSRLSSVGPDGREIVTSEIGTPLRDYSEDPIFKKAAGGDFAMTEVYISSEHIPYVTMGVPVRQLGKVSGVLRAEVNLRGFWDIVDNIKIGRTGRAYVVSKDGVLIAGEDKKRVLENENLSDDEAVKAVLQGKTGSIESANPRGRWLQAYAPIKALGWGVIVKQAAGEAYSFLEVMRWESWVLIFLSLCVAVLVSVVLARLLVKPIKLLSQRMQLVAQGNLDQHLVIERRDEIGDLIGAFNQMTEKLKRARESEKLATIGKAAAAIAHELKNSLVMAGTFIGLLPKRNQDPEFLKKFSTVLPQEFESWKDMLQDISDYARKSDFELAPVNVNSLITDFNFLAEQRLAQSNARLCLEVPKDLPVIRGNSQKLKQTLMNLVINALEAMPEGGTVKIIAEAAPEDSRSPKVRELRIRVQDEGKGIPKEALSAIFEPFHTTKRNGLGLGLAISREIVERHGGKLEVESELGKGTIFTLRLPIDHP